MVSGEMFEAHWPEMTSRSSISLSPSLKSSSMLSICVPAFRRWELHQAVKVYNKQEVASEEAKRSRQTGNDGMFFRENQCRHFYWSYPFPSQNCHSLHIKRNLLNSKLERGFINTEKGVSGPAASLSLSNTKIPLSLVDNEPLHHPPPHTTSTYQRQDCQKNNSAFTHIHQSGPGRAHPHCKQGLKTPLLKQGALCVHVCMCGLGKPSGTSVISWVCVTSFHHSTLRELQRKTHFPKHVPESNYTHLYMFAQHTKWMHIHHLHWELDWFAS